MDHGDLIAVGHFFKGIVDRPEFRTVVSILSEQYNTEILSSDWTEKDRREQAYQKFKVLTDLLSTINSTIVIYEQAVSTQPDLFDIEDDDDELV